ncbi:MAG: acyltransferase [Rhizobiaceae bacterium]|nr:acyltransferase [Rhizobiaceae bacterium]
MLTGSNRERHYIRGFDGIRAIAVLIVILGHANITGPLFREHYPFVFYLVTAPRGVDIFFVLSGFLITTLLIGEYDRYHSVNLWNFLVRRSFRLLPLYYLYCAALIVFSLIFVTGFRWEGLPFLLLNIFNFVPNGLRTAINGHIWSLSIEWHFYLVWPLVFASFFSRGKTIPILALIGTLLACVVAIRYYPRSGMFNYLAWTIPAAIPIVIGALAAMLFGRRKSFHWIALPVGLFLYALPGLQSFPLTGAMLRASGVALVVIWVYCNQQSFVVSALEFRPLRFIGMISYGLYVWHVFFIGTGPSRAAGQNWPPNQMLGLVLTMIVAPLSYYYFERPMQSLQKRFLQPRQREEPRSTPALSSEKASA